MPQAESDGTSPARGQRALQGLQQGAGKRLRVPVWVTLGSFHQRTVQSSHGYCPESPMGQGKVETGEVAVTRAGGGEIRHCTPREGNKETRVVEAVALVSLQHRFFTCEKRSKTIKHIKETFEKVRSPLTWLCWG